MIVVKTRHANVRPDRENCSMNAALRNRVKKSIEKTQQEEAFKELLKLMGANGGKAPYGEVKNIVKAYNANGFKAKTRQNLYYCLSQLKFSTTSSKDNTNSQLVGTIVTGNNTEGVMSDLTEEPVASVTQQGIQVETEVVISKSNNGGQKAGSTKEKEEEDKQKLAEVMSRRATLFTEKVKEARK